MWAEIWKCNGDIYGFAIWAAGFTAIEQFEVQSVKKSYSWKILRSGILKKFINLLQIFVKTGVVFSRANGL